MTNNPDHNNTALELRITAADAAALIRTLENNDGPGVAALINQLDPHELPAMIMALAGLVSSSWRAAYRAGVRFGSLHVSEHEVDAVSVSEDLAGLSAAELKSYLSAVVRAAHESS